MAQRRKGATAQRYDGMMVPQKSHLTDMRNQIIRSRELLATVTEVT